MVVSGCALAFGSATAGAQQAKGAVTTCEGEWRPFDKQVKTNERLSFENMNMAKWRDGIVTVGDPAIRWTTENPDTVSLIGAVYSRQDSIHAVWEPYALPLTSKPAAAPMPMSPRAATTSDGLLHVVYGVKSDMRKREWDTYPDTLWHRAFDGVRWTEPERLPAWKSGPGIWEQISPSQVVADGQAIDVAVPVLGSDNVTIELLHRTPSTGWTVTPIVTGGYTANYVRMLRLGKQIILSYAAPDLSQKRDRSSVFVLTSIDEGRNFTKPVRVHLAGVGTTYDHALMSSDDGRLFLAWRQENGERPIPSYSIGVAVSTDSGRTWLEGPTLPVSGGIIVSRFGMTQWGPVAVYWKAGTATEQIALFHDDRWIVIENRGGPPSTNGSSPLQWERNTIAFIGTRNETFPGHQDARSSSAPVLMTVTCK